MTTLDEVIECYEKMDFIDQYRQLAEWLKELKQLREQTRWLPVSERSGEQASDIKVGDEVMTKTMEEIEIVLKISEEDYINLQKKNKLNDMFLNYYEKLIAHGTPLPKGHGDLIDRKELLNEAQADGAYGYISVKEIYDSEIIIKADKAESEKKHDFQSYR